jgi:hypothetical protein
MSSFCCICYLPIEIMSIGCSNYFCTSKICAECLESYLKFYIEDKKNIPKCPSTECKNGEILYSEICKLNNKELVDIYEKLVLLYLKNYSEDNIILEKNQKKLIEKIRKEKHDFILNSFSASISFIIETSLKSKLKSIDKKNRQHITQMTNKINKKCPNIMCRSGILDVDFTCMTCSEKYCIKCENKIVGNEHVCKKEDIDSLQEIEKLVKCPKCKLPVVKSYGCHNMTCSICKTNFDYISGRITKAGNHSNDTLVLKTNHKLSNILSEKEEYNTTIINLMRRIENKEPENYSFNNIILLLKKYIDAEEKNDTKSMIKLMSEMAKTYEIYKERKNEKEKYIKYISNINETLNKNELTEEFLHKMNSIIE